jgi:hypothetical protein
MEVTMDEIKENQQDQHETTLDHQCRSMQDNLIVYGIDEPKRETGEYENTEDCLNIFLINKMKIHKSITFQRYIDLARGEGIKLNQGKSLPNLKKIKIES